MDQVLNNLGPILTSIINQASAAQPGWFSNYIGVVAFDSTYNRPYSNRVEETNPTNFVNNLVAAASVKFNSTQKSRALFTALSIALASSKIQHRSQGYIISAANAEDPQLLNGVLVFYLFRGKRQR